MDKSIRTGWADLYTRSAVYSGNRTRKKIQVLTASLATFLVSQALLADALAYARLMVASAVIAFSFSVYGLMVAKQARRKQCQIIDQEADSSGSNAVTAEGVILEENKLKNTCSRLLTFTAALLILPTVLQAALGYSSNEPMIVPLPAAALVVGIIFGYLYNMVTAFDVVLALTALAKKPQEKEE